MNEPDPELSDLPQLRRQLSELQGRMDSTIMASELLQQVACGALSEKGADLLSDRLAGSFDVLHAQLNRDQQEIHEIAEGLEEHVGRSQSASSC